MTYSIDKTLLLESAWDRSMQARQQMLVNNDNAMNQTARENVGQYIANPFIGGPVNHIATKVAKGINGGVYNVLKNKESDALINTANVTAQANTNQPWNVQQDVAIKSAENYGKTVDGIKKDHAAQYYLNPMTVGPMGHSVANSVANSMRNFRSIASPTTTVGSTIQK